MAPEYRYIGDMPTAFISLRKDGKTWTPSKGDTIKSSSPLAHPLLELVVREEKKAKPTEEAAPEVETSEPADHENKSPVTVDQPEEN
jgi:hypothetical protein